MVHDVVALDADFPVFLPADTSEVYNLNTSPKRASIFANSDEMMRGVGSFFFSKQFWIKSSAEMMYKCFPVKPTDVTEGKVALIDRELEKLIMDSFTMLETHETSTKGYARRGVQEDHLDELCRRLTKNLWKTTTTNKTPTLKSMECPHGVATESSQPDGFIMRRLGKKLFLGGVLEAKGTSHSLKQALRQAYAASTNVALAHRAKGISSKSVAVPVVVTNGHCMQFGVTRVLEPSLPYFTNVSKVLDLSNGSDRREAAFLLALVDYVCDKVALEPDPSHVFRGEIRWLSKNQYHLKKLPDLFRVLPTLDASLAHMMKLMGTLLNHEKARQFVVAPLTVLTPATCIGDKDGEKEIVESGALVFNNLAFIGYRIGFPKDQSKAKAFVVAIEEACKSIHDAGVVHMDLYPSNIMWKEVENLNTDDETGTIVVKIIDWDAAHAKGERLTEAARAAMDGKTQRHLPGINMEKALPEWDRSLISVMKWAADDPETCARLCLDDKAELDAAFWELTTKFYAQVGTE